MTDTDLLPRWSIADVHESLSARTFVDAMERCSADADRLVALFDDHDVRACEPRRPTAHDGAAADAVIRAYNELADHLRTTSAAIRSVVAVDSRDDHAQSMSAELSVTSARITPLLARLADWVHALGVDELAEHSDEVSEHRAPLRRLAERAAHQMSEAEEGLHAELGPTGPTAWATLHQNVTSQLTATVDLPDGTVELPITTVRGMAMSDDPARRRAAYDAELVAWPTVKTVAAAAINAIKGDADVVNRRRNWESPLAASLYANSVGRDTFDAMHASVTDALGDLRRWMRAKAVLHGHDADAGLPWWDLRAPLPSTLTGGPAEVGWDEGVERVRTAFGAYGPELAGLVDRALHESWIDAPPADGKRGGAFCTSFTGDRSLVLLNWSGSADSVQTTAHELGHAYHNTTLAHRTPLQRRLPMALAETASIFCETLVVEDGLSRARGAERLALLDVDLVGTNQVIVDIRSRFLFETELFARRHRRTLGGDELDDMMRAAQAEAYGDGLDPSTAHPHMWVLKPHYYTSHFYNWPYTYGLLFGLGLFAEYRDDPERFRAGYDDLLSRAGIDSAEELGASFGLDVTDEAFWRSSLDVVRARIDEYERLAAEHGPAAS